ncbi:Alcohol dehydrogenase, class IV [Sporobacter termitidis DSM 10068]|uniref:Alcohol dehydrogenase, class IV n=1 Tax=Sporobacter termitidis DSM 10068 TaxID=1123282 RepID=A0A1M5ZBQ6_9FIRM|nr:iron-containing alcohol dehydrogenase [Sporobacter termitidis]SHI21667.1 Alcohol dehydrogenase, class IV [Sporobacter termitidis DSM 10068]
MQSIFSSPNPLLFGAGTSRLVGEKLKEFGCKKVLVVFDKGIKSSGVADRIINIIGGAGIETVTYDGVQADPPDWSVEEAGGIGVRERVDGVVGVGGGSSLDTAKGAKLLQTNPPPINKYFGREGVVTKPSVPLIVIPTTAGTGSECTPGGVITDTKNNIKTNIAGVGCAVSLGIVDPELTLGLPPAVTASTGMDALCHAVESYTSNLSNSFCALTGKKAFILVGKYLVRAFENGADLEAREGMMLASSLGGISMSGPLCHLAHDIGKVLGGRFHVPHGNACASCLPQVLETIAPAVPEKVRDVTAALGGTVPEDAAPETLGRAARDTVRALMTRLKLPALRDYGAKNGFTKADLLEVVPPMVVTMQEGLVRLFGQGTSPVPATEALVASIVSRAWEEN